MAKIEKGNGHNVYPYWTVVIHPNELNCGYKKYPYSTWLGTIKQDGKINVWSPVGYKPRGYVTAGRQVLEDIRDKFMKDGQFSPVEGEIKI